MRRVESGLVERAGLLFERTAMTLRWPGRSAVHGSASPATGGPALQESSRQ
jgi:hypothetical protein